MTTVAWIARVTCCGIAGGIAGETLLQAVIATAALLAFVDASIYLAKEPRA